MRMVAVIKNKEHPEYGEISIPLPIKNSEYSRTMEMLSSLGFGDVLKKDCQIVELMRTFSIMTQLEGTQVNIDELDYLAKRLDGFEVGQEIQFEAVAAAKGLTSIDEFIVPLKLSSCQLAQIVQIIRIFLCIFYIYFQFYLR